MIQTSCCEKTQLSDGLIQQEDLPLRDFRRMLWVCVTLQLVLKYGYGPLSDSLWNDPAKGSAAAVRLRINKKQRTHDKLSVCVLPQVVMLWKWWADRKEQEKLVWDLSPWNCLFWRFNITSFLFQVDRIKLVYFICILYQIMVPSFKSLLSLWLYTDSISCKTSVCFWFSHRLHRDCRIVHNQTTTLFRFFFDHSVCEHKATSKNNW